MNNSVKVGALSLCVMIIFFIATPQSNITQAFAIALLIFAWTLFIFIIGIPAWRNSLRKYLNYIHPTHIPVIFVIIPYIILIISGGTQLDSVIELTLWYLIPSILFLLPEVFEEKMNPDQFPVIRIVVTVIATGILWIGFDNRYTSVLFDGFKGASYILNAIWMACIMMITFGRYIGVEDPKNEYDKGMALNKYGIKIAIIAMPIASIIIIPFGLLTGFLQWDPQKFDILVITISFIGIFLTIALQEELVFRGIMQNELTKLKIAKENKYAEYGIIILVTAAFALSHWNNDVPPFVFYYIIAAFIAGLAYAISYKKGGLFASMITHTLIDWIWGLLFKRP